MAPLSDVDTEQRATGAGATDRLEVFSAGSAAGAWVVVLVPLIAVLGLTTGTILLASVAAFVVGLVVPAATEEPAQRSRRHSVGGVPFAELYMVRLSKKGDHFRHHSRRY